MAGRIVTVDLMLDNSSIYKVIENPTKELLQKTVEEFERNNPLYDIYNFKAMNQLQETYTSSVGTDRMKYRTNEMGLAKLAATPQEGFSGTKRYRMYSGSFKITKVAMLEAKQSGNFDAIAYLTQQQTKTWLRNNVEDGTKALDGAFGTAVYGDDGETDYMFVTTDTVDGRTGQYAVNSARNPLFSNAHTFVRKSGLTDAQYAALGTQSNFYYTDAINLLGSDPGKIAKLADLINQIVTNMENQRDDNGKLAGLHGEKVIVAPNDARLKAALFSAINEPSLRGYGDQSNPNPAYKRIADCKYSAYWNELACLYNKSNNTARGFFIVDKAYMAANNGLELTQRFPMEVTSEEHKNPAHLEVIFSEGMEFNCLTWRGITYVNIAPDDGTNLFTIPAARSVTGANVNIARSAGTYVTCIDTIVKPVSIVGTVDTDVVHVTDVEIDATAAVTAAAGDNHTKQLTVTVTPANADNKQVLYFSSNTAVATVSATGLVTGVLAGSATITVVSKDGGKTDTCAVTVS